MKKFLVAILAMGIGLTQFNCAEAGAVGSLVFNEINELEDDNFEVFFKQQADGSYETATTGTIEVGDRFLGSISVQGINSPPGELPAAYTPGADDPTFTGIFAIEAAAKEDVDVSGSGDIDTTNIFFKPLETTDWDDSFGITGFNPNNANTVAMFWDDVTQGELSTSGSLQDALSTFQGTNKVWEFGYEGADFADDGVSDLGEFFVTTGNEGIDTVGSDLGSISNLINLNLLENNSVPLVKHTWLETDGAAEPAAVGAGVTFGAEAHLQASGDIANTSASGPFPIRTDTNLYIKPVPEPSSLAIFAVAAVGLAGLRSRRRKQA